METYEEVLNYIHSRPRKHRSDSLETMHQILDALDNPQNAYKEIHVTGTNGKGSVTQILSQLITNSGFKVGTFVSPFIRSFNERIQIDGQPISDEDLIYWTNAIHNKVLAIQAQQPDFELAEFELVTAIMFSYFRAEKIELAVIEVGIGGTHDKTNVFTPLLSVITTVGMDHMALIGPTLADIATEKAGIIKAGRPVIVGRVTDSVFHILEKRAEETHSELFLFGRDFRVDHIQLAPEYTQIFNFSDANMQLTNIHLNSLARYEIDNAAVALMAYDQFCQIMNLTIFTNEVKDVLSETLLLGRAEILDTEPLILLDGAHNPQAMKRLFESVALDFPQTTIHIVAAFMQDKAIDQLMPILQAQNNASLYLTTLEMDRAADQAQIQPLMGPRDRYFEPWQRAFLEAYHNASYDDLIVITGSIYLVAQARQYLLEGGHQDGV